MTQNISSSFLEIEIKTDVIKKYIGMPIIYHHYEGDDSSFLVSGILSDVNNIQIYLEKVSIFYDDDGNDPWYDETMMNDGQWRLHGNTFTKEDIDTPLLLKYIQFIYVSKETTTLEQMQNMFVNPK
jgi:hypothetical protein